MQVSQSFRGFVQPFADVFDITVQSITEPVFRNARVQFFLVGPTILPSGEEIVDIDTLQLDFLPSAHEWVEVWYNGFRLINSTTDFGQTRAHYVHRNNRLLFNEPFVGRVKIICDGYFGYEMPPENYIHINNEQGARTKNTVAGQALVAQFCEPIVVGEPRNGFARLTDDRKSIVYVPDLDFVGYDSFSYAIVGERGQVSTPKCVFVTVGEPEKEETEEPAEPNEPTE